MTMQTAKISDQFSARLDQLQPRQKVRAIVMLDAGQPAPASRREAILEDQPISLLAQRKI